MNLIKFVLFFKSISIIYIVSLLVFILLFFILLLEDLCYSSFFRFFYFRFIFFIYIISNVSSYSTLNIVWINNCLLIKLMDHSVFCSSSKNFVIIFTTRSYTFLFSCIWRDYNWLAPPYSRNLFNITFWLFISHFLPTKRTLKRV